MHQNGDCHLGSGHSQDRSNILLNFFVCFLIFLARKRSKTYLKSLIKLFGFISTDYEAVASHGDPIQAIFSEIAIPIFHYILRNVKLKLFFYFLAGAWRGADPSKKMHIECLYL